MIAPTLAHETISLPLILTVDASLTHAGGVLEQTTDPEFPNGCHGTRPLGFFSKAFPFSVGTRSTFNRELTALYMSLRHFKHRVRGRPLIIRTDHASLVKAVNNPGGEHSPNEHCLIHYVKEYQPTIIHIKGKDNVVADALSRPELTCDRLNVIADEPCLSINRQLIAESQHDEYGFIDSLQNSSTPLVIENVQTESGTLPLYGKKK